MRERKSPVSHITHYASLSVPLQLFQIAVKVSFHFSNAVSAELLAGSIGQNYRHHSFTDHSRSRDRNNIRAFEGSGRFFFCDHINTCERLPQGRYRFQVTAYSYLFAVGYPTLDPACPIGGPGETVIS